MGNQIEKKYSSVKKKFGSSDPNDQHSSPLKDNTIGIEF